MFHKLTEKRKSHFIDQLMGEGGQEKESMIY